MVFSAAFAADVLANARCLQQVTLISGIDERLRRVAGGKFYDASSLLANAQQRPIVDHLHTLFRPPVTKNLFGAMRLEKPGQLLAVMLS